MMCLQMFELQHTVAHTVPQLCCVFPEVLGFAGSAPEIINGRLSMLGVTAALAAEAVTGKDSDKDSHKCRARVHPSSARLQPNLQTYTRRLCSTTLKSSIKKTVQGQKHTIQGPNTDSDSRKQ